MGRLHPHGDGHHGHDHRDVGDHCGYETGRERVTILENILGENDRIAEAQRCTSLDV